MVFELVGPFGLGVGTSIVLGSPIERAIHKYLLHATPKNRKEVKFIDNMSFAHNDNHHAAYKGPAHYYRDITNEQEVIHFAKKDVGVIAGLALVAGGAIDAGYSVVRGNLNLDVTDAFFVSGIVAGSMFYYGCYEFTHHYMHVIGRRRLEINRAFGDEIQGGWERRDGNLRLSKPLLDDICNEVEQRVDIGFKNRTADFKSKEGLIQRLDEQLDYNAKIGKANISSVLGSPVEVIDTTANVMFERERRHRDNLNKKGKINNMIGRKVRSSLRNSPIFRYLDNHHFLHHYRYGKNLNVVFPLADFIMRTKMDSSESVLESDKKYWLCPNSPDVEIFKPKRSKLYASKTRQN